MIQRTKARLIVPLVVRSLIVSLRLLKVSMRLRKVCEH